VWRVAIDAEPAMHLRRPWGEGQVDRTGGTRPPLDATSSLVAKVVHHPPDSVLQHLDVEVDEKTHGIPAEPRVGEQLCAMQRGQGIDAFHFDDDPIVDDEIDAVRARRSEGLPVNGDRPADLDVVTRLDEPSRQAEIDRRTRTGPARIVGVRRWPWR
jgi:hypothetical protein